MTEKKGSPSDAADRIIAQYREKNLYLRDAVQLICELTASEDPQTAGAGLTALFPGLVERLNDSFDPRSCRLYDLIFAQVIDFYRRLAAGAELDRGLRDFGLLSEADLLDRKSRIRLTPFPDRADARRVKKALLLSRVTIGADVAVTGVALAKLRRTLPEAEFVLIGSRKLRELFGGDERVRVRQLGYERGGGLLSRLTSWLEVAAIVEDETRNLGPEEFWVIDPDSRLTQLGLLPLLKDERHYFFFESRGFQPRNPTTDPAAKLLGRLTSHWIGEVTGDPEPVYPFIALPRELREFGRMVGSKLREARTERIVTVSFGVGGNQRKRLPDSFEESLVERLLTDSTLILDKGASDDERNQVDRLIRKVRDRGKTIIELNERNAAAMEREPLAADLVTWDGGIGIFSALTAAGDRYLGYDSAGQHIAAALGVPTLTVFVNSNSGTFAERWRPYGPGPIETVTLDPEHLPDQNRLLAEILERLR
ncbi:MAG TPA: hypothetical protein VJ302_15350 [Blastocatellia bacterium]|nr:hypothetical protein [Blastocatellia bacterium]